LSRLVPLAVVDVIWWGEADTAAPHRPAAGAQKPASLLDRLRALVARAGGGSAQG